MAQVCNSFDWSKFTSQIDVFGKVLKSLKLSGVYSEEIIENLFKCLAKLNSYDFLDFSGLIGSLHSIKQLDSSTLDKIFKIFSAFGKNFNDK